MPRWVLGAAIVAVVLAATGAALAVARSGGEKDQFCVELGLLYDHWDAAGAELEANPGMSGEAQAALMKEADAIIDDVIAAADPSVRQSVDGFWHLDSNPSLDDGAADRYNEARTEFRAYVTATCGPGMLRDEAVEGDSP